MGNCFYNKHFEYNDVVQGQSLAFKPIFDIIKLTTNDLDRLFTGIFYNYCYTFIINYFYMILFIMIYSFLSNGC
jgi:hypothetical protein